MTDELKSDLHILHIAAENAGLPGAKEGGVADVIHHISKALVRQNCSVTTLIPSHGFLHQLPGARQFASVPFQFRGQPHTAEVYEIRPPGQTHEVRHCVLHHPLLDAYDAARRRYRIYVHDDADQPFYHDSNRFACFSAAAAAAAAQGVFGNVDVLHLHDWHAALVALLRKTDPVWAARTRVRTVFSIHNLGIQGIRPLSGNPASLEAWFPNMRYEWLDVADPRWPDCANLMATGIRLGDRIHTVSPSYAEEIQYPSRKPHFFGAEGLESVIAHVRNHHRLFGILNGCDYSAPQAQAPVPAEHWIRRLQQDILHWTADQGTVSTEHFVAYQRLGLLPDHLRSSHTVLATVGRVVDQKMRLLREPGANGLPALERILDVLGDKGVWMILGTGDPDYERYLTRMGARHDNLIYLNGYSEVGAHILYSQANLFIMPSSYEPCGLSQMLAMRSGSPCVVHGVGGLRDTVRHLVNGFVFQGDTITEQAENFIATTIEAIATHREAGQRWQEICHQAGRTKFEWTTSAESYRRLLYDP